MKYPIKEVKVAGKIKKIPFIKFREDFEDVVNYKLKQEDIDPSPPHIYSNLSYKFYGTPDLWYLIDDVNPLFHESDLREGIIVKIPNISTRKIPVNNVISSNVI